jgi:hypothetical protein
MQVQCCTSFVKRVLSVNINIPRLRRLAAVCVQQLPHDRTLYHSSEEAINSRLEHCTYAQ